MEAQRRREEGDPHLPLYTSKDATATPPSVKRVVAALTASASRATSPPPTHDGEEDNERLSWTALPSGSASPRDSMARCSFSMLSRSPMTRRHAAGGKEEDVDGDGSASLLSTVAKGPQVSSLLSPLRWQKKTMPSSLPPDTTRTSSAAASTGPSRSPNPTLPGRLLSLPSTAEVAGVNAQPTAAASLHGSAIGADAPMPGHSLSLLPAAPPLSAPATEVPEAATTHSLDDAAEESSLLPAAPITLLADTAATLGESAADAGDAIRGVESNESDGSHTGAPHARCCDNDGQIASLPVGALAAARPLATVSGGLPRKFTELPPLLLCPASAGAGERDIEGCWNAPSDFPQSLPFPAAPLLCEPPQRPSNQPRSILEEWAGDSGRLGHTSDSRSAKIWEVMTVDDASDSRSDQRCRHHISTHRRGGTAERGAACMTSTTERRGTRECSGRHGQWQDRSRHPHTGDSGTEDSCRLSLHASTHQPLEGRCPVGGSTLISIAAPSSGLAPMAGATASGLPQQPAVHQRLCSSLPASGHAHRTRMKLSTAPPSLVEVDALISTETVEVSSTWSSLPSSSAPPPAVYSSSAAQGAPDRTWPGSAHGDSRLTGPRCSSRGSPPSGWPNAIFPISEDEDEDESVTTLGGKALPSCAQAQRQQGQERRGCTDEDVLGKTTFVAIAAGEMPPPPPSPSHLAAQAREVTTVAVAPPPLHAEEYNEGTRTGARATAPASLSLLTLGVAVTGRAISPPAGRETAAATALSTTLPAALAHYPSRSSSPSAPVAASPPQLTTLCQQSSPRTPAVAAPELLPVIEKKAAVAPLHVHHAARSTTAPSSTSVSPSSSADIAKGESTAAGAAAARGGHDAEGAVNTSTSAVFVESDAVPIPTHLRLSSSALPAPVLTSSAAAAADTSRGTHRDAYPASYAYVNVLTSADGASGGSECSETLGSLVALRSVLAGRNRLSTGSLPDSAILGKTPLSTAQIGAHRVSSEGESGHGSDAASRWSSGEWRKGTGLRPSHTGTNHREDCNDSGSSYSYSYSYSWSTGGSTGSAMRGTRSHVARVAPQKNYEREGAATAGMIAAPCTGLVELSAYEAVTPVVGGWGRAFGWVRCGRQRATGGERTSRTEVRLVCQMAEDTRAEHFISCSSTRAERHMALREREGRATPPVTTTGTPEANITVGSEEKTEGQETFRETRSRGAPGSEGSHPARGLNSTTETLRSSERDVGEGAEGVCETATYADRPGSMDSVAGGAVPLGNWAETFTPPRDDVEELEEGDSGVLSQGERGEAAPTAAEQVRVPPLDLVDGPAFGSTASVPPAGMYVRACTNKEVSSSAGCHAGVVGASASSDVSVLERQGSASGSGESAPFAAAADAAATDGHLGSTDSGVRGGGGEEGREGGAATTASVAVDPLLALLACMEELPRLRAWDAEPPVVESTSSPPPAPEAERLKVKCNDTAITTPEVGLQVFHRSVRQLTVRPPRQCVFMEVHGLRRWCSALLCPQQVPRAGLAHGAAAVLTEEQHGAWGGSAQANAPIVQDPRWIDARLAMYRQDGARERLLAAGSTFSLPSNLEALRRCLGGDGSVEYISKGGYGRDSWSDLLVLQLPADGAESAAEGGVQTEGCAHAAIVATTVEDKAGHTSDPGCSGGDTPSPRASQCGLAGSSLLGSLVSKGTLYVKLEGRGDLSVSKGEKCALAVTMRATEVTSRGTDMNPFTDTQPSAAAAGATDDRAEDLAMPSQCSEEDVSQSSVQWQTEPSPSLSSLRLSVDAAPSPSAASGVEYVRDGTHHSIWTLSDRARVNVLETGDSGAGEHAAATGTLHEECWRSLAVSPPLLLADVCQHQSDRPPLLTALGTTADVAANAVARLGQPLPQLSCRLRWAQVPQPQSAATPEAAARASSGERGLSSWASLGAAIEEYERVCRCPAAATVSPVSADGSVGGAAVRQTPSWPLTVLWSTIPSYLTVEKDKLREMREASVVAAPQEWCGGELPPRGHAMETLTVCSVVVRCAAAILLTDEVAGMPGSRYGPATSISVTGGCDGVVVERSAMIGGEDAHSTPIMQYNVSFHAVLTRDTASSLLFTLHSAASPAEVFGFAVWTPFDAASAMHVQQQQRQHHHRAGGVADVWLPLFAPVSADAAPAAIISVEWRGTAPPDASAAARTNRNNGQIRSASGLVLVGWLHCDVEAFFLPSLAEETVEQLWNGPRRSFSSLAAAPGGEREYDECCLGRGIRADDDTLVDFSVVEGAGLRPLTTRIGKPLSPTPLRWDDSASWGNNNTCAHVYCEVLAVQQQRQQETSRRVLRPVLHTAGVFSAASSSWAAGAVGYGPPTSDYRQRSVASSGFDFVSFASESGRQGRALLSESGEVDGEPGACAAWTGASAALPVTASVTHTNHPRWQHTFRLGCASLFRLHLRVFDLRQHCLDSYGGDGSETRPQVAEDDTTRARCDGTSGRRAMLLGTATVSSWLLRRMLSRPYGEGCAWLPLLWRPEMAAVPTTASVTTNGKWCVEEHSSPAVCNGFVLVKWRRLPEATAVAWSPCCREPSSWYASVTRRSLNSNGRHATGSKARPRSSLWKLRRLHNFPPSWYQPVISKGAKPVSMTAAPEAYSPQLGWMSPEVVPWLRIHEVRVQWPWLQHLLCMHGGQVRLSLRYPTAQGGTRLLASCLLVPLCELAGPSTSAVCGRQPSRVHSQETHDSAAVYGMVLSTPPLYSAVPPTKSSAPTEAALCLPANPSIEVQVWWYPRESAGAAGGGCSNAPPRFIGRGEWRFPAHDVAAEIRGGASERETGALDEALNPPLTTAGAAGLAGLSDEEEEDGSAMRPAPLPTSLRSFFTLHEADVRVAPVHSTGLPQHVEGGVLTWRLMSFPRLVCDDWGKVPPAMLPWPPESPSCLERRCVHPSHPSRTPFVVRPASTWVMPDVGTPARVHVEVRDMICFDHVDELCIDAAQATEAVQIVVSGTACDNSMTESSPDDSAAIEESRCWVFPGDVPPTDAPRVAYAFSAVCSTTANGADTWSNTGGDEKSVARNAGSDAGASRFATVEVQWPSRRFGWIDNAPPSLYVWVMTPSSFSGGAGAEDDTGAAAAGGRERVWGAVRLPRLDGFTSTSGTLWLPLFRSSVAPSLAAEIPRCRTVAEDVVTSSGGGGGNGEHFGAGSVPPRPSPVEGAECDIPATAPQSALPSGDAANPLMMLAAPRAAVVVRHVGFVEVRYEHNMQRRADVAVTPGGAELSAAAPRVLLASVGPLHRRFPAGTSARGAAGSSSSPSSCKPYAPMLTPSSGAAQMAVPAATNTADAAAAVDVLLADATGGTEVLLGVEAHQLSMRVPDAVTDQDGSSQEGSSGRVAVFPLPERSCGDGSSRQMRVQVRVDASAAMATNTMYFDPGDGGDTAESAQWVPLVVRRRLHNARGVDYDGEGESVVAEILVQWRAVNLPATAAAPSCSTFSPLSLQRLVREYCGGSGASCSYTVLSTRAAIAQLRQSLSRQDRADVLQRACCSKLSEKAPKGQDMITAELASQALSRVLRTIEPRRHRCVYLGLDQILLQCSTRQWLAWAALQRGTTAPPQEMRADGRHGGDVSAPLRFRLEVQLRWPAEWNAVWRRTVSPSLQRVLLGSETGAAASWTPAAASFATATAGVVSLNVWVDSAEGVFVESSASTASGAAVGGEAAAYTSEEHLFSCASLSPLYLVLPSPQDIEHALGEPGLAARFSLTFALFALLQGRGDDEFPEEKASEVCVGAGRTPVTFYQSVQFGLTSLLPPTSSVMGGTAPCADAVDTDEKDDAAAMPALLRWRVRVTESLPVLPPVSSTSRISPRVRNLAPGSGKGMEDGAAGCGEPMPSWLLSSVKGLAGEEREEAIEGNRHTQATGPTSPALARITVTRIELCGVDISLACGVAQRHLRVLPPAMVTVMVADIMGATAAPTDRRGGATATAPTVQQLLPRLLLLSPTAASTPVGATSTVTLPMTRPPPPQQQRYVWSTDVCLAASLSQLVFNISVPSSALLSARAEEAWLSPRRPSSKAEPQEADEQAADACCQSLYLDRVNVSGRAVYALDLSMQVDSVRSPCGDSWLVSAAQTAGGTRDVVLDVESLVHGRWLGRLWAQVDITAAELLMRDAALAFFTSRMSLSVRGCTGFAVGDVLLTRRVEETYTRLRERAALLWKERGRMPRRLRQQMKEIREIRRQLRQGHEQQCDGALTDQSALSTAGVVRVTSAWGEQGTSSLSTCASKPFALPTATELARQGLRAATRPASTGAPLLCISRDINTAPMREGSTATVRLELCEASSGFAVAAGQMVLPLRSARTLWRQGTWQPPLSTVTSPLSMRVALQPCAMSETGTRRIRPVSSSAGVADVTAAWSVQPARGDTWLTCIYVKPTADGDGVATPLRRLLLRWTYCFEGTAYPETEHAVDMPLRSRPSLTASDHDGKGAQMPHAGHHLRDDVPVYWSGVAMQLPRIGPVGATLKRVQLLEVTPVSCAHLFAGGAEEETAQSSPLEPNLPTRNVCMTTQLAAHEWSVADELSFETRRRQAQSSGEDSLVWLTCEAASAASGRCCRGGYEVLLGLSTSNSIAKGATKLLEHRTVRATGDEAFVAPPESEKQRPRWHPRIGANVLVTRDGARPVKADTLPSSPTPHERVCDSTSSSGGGAVHGATGSAGGVLMRALTFRCSEAALAASQLGQVDTLTCRIVALRRGGDGGAAPSAYRSLRSEKAKGTVDYAEAPVVVLDAGGATSFTREHDSTEDPPCTTTASPPPPLALASFTAAWSPTLRLSRSTVMGPCAVAVGSSADAHHSMQEAPSQTREGALLRVMLPVEQPDPVLAAVGNGGAGDVGSDSSGGATTMLEEQFRIEVAVCGRRYGASAERVAATACFVSTPFCASDILRSARSCGEHSGVGGRTDAPLAVAGSGSQLYMPPSHWSSTLAMQLVSAPVGDGMTNSAARERNKKERETGPLPARAAPMAVIEVTWALDLLGVLPTSASATGVVLASAECSRCRAHRDSGHEAEHAKLVLSSAAGKTNGTDEDDDMDGGGVSMRQLEAYSAWSDFLAAQHSEAEIPAAQAKLRHWRCTIVGVEVSGVELPLWCSTETDIGADTGSEVFDAAQCTSLLAQLVLPIVAPRTAACADAERQPKQDSDSAGRRRRRRLHNQGELVIGVARTTLTRMDRGACPDTGAATASGDGAAVNSDTCGTRCVTPARISSSRPRSHRYTATFTPLSWRMAVKDMIAQATATEHLAKEKTAAAAVSGAPAAGLTVWQLLPGAPAQLPSVRNGSDDGHSTTQDTTQVVYNLGSTQLACLLRESALYLVQVLARWCRHEYTTQERDALLETAALYPTQWMPLAPATPFLDGTQSEACVRFKCAYSYHGPMLLLPKSLATVLPPRITAPRAMADSVFCAQLNHVQLTYTSLDGTGAVAATAESHCPSGASAAAAWLSRLILGIRVRVTTESAVDGTVVDSRCVAQWHTRLTPVPCGGAPPVMEAVSEEDRVTPAAPSATLQTVLAPTLPMTEAVPMPDPVPVSVTVASSSGEGTCVSAELLQKRVDEDHKHVAAASVATSSATGAVPMLPTTFLCWQPSRLAEKREGCGVAQASATVPTASVTETTTTTSVETVLLLLPDEKTEEVDGGAAVSFQGRLSGGDGGAIAGTLVGRAQVLVGCSSSSEVAWDAAEERVEHGWRLCAPLCVRLPVTAEAALPRSGHDASACAVSPEVWQKENPQPSSTLSFDLLIFTAPSTAHVAALQASRAAYAEQRCCRLSALKRVEEALVASATNHHLHDQASETNTDACVTTAGQPQTTLGQLSRMWMSRMPYRLLRAPPTVIRVDTFAIWDGVLSSSEGCTAASLACGNGEGVATRLLQMLWTMPQRPVLQSASTHVVTGDVPGPSQGCRGGGLGDGTNNGAVPVEVQARLVDEQTGEVRAPVWTLLSSGPPVLHNPGAAAARTSSHAPSLASHLHSGRAILCNAQRLRLDWCCCEEGDRQQSSSLLAALAGLVGGASVAYMAANGSACLWVSGGLRRRCAQGALHSTSYFSLLQGGDGGGNSGRRASEPAPPLSRSLGHHRSPGRRRGRRVLPPRAVMVTPKSSLPLPSPGLDVCTASCPLDYDLYVSHFLSWTAGAPDEQAAAPRLRCAVHTPVASSLSAVSPGTSAVPRLFHSATLVGGRIWLLGGWAAPAGVETLPAASSALVSAAGLVERRRREVRQAVAHDSNNDAAGDLLSPIPLAECAFRSAGASASNAQCKTVSALSSASLIWCEEVHSVQCLDDGFPAPSVSVSSPFSKEEDCTDTTGGTSCWLATPPRLACHVAVACGDRCAALFGGLMVPTGDDDAPVSTAAVHIYDTVQGRWSAQYGPNKDVQGEWPVARYGHCVAPVPGTDGVRQPRSYFVFGGATATPSCRTLPVPPAQLLWIWTPVLRLIHRGSSSAVEMVSVHSTWQRVQLPAGLSTPLSSRFLSQLHAYSAAEVAAAASGSTEPFENGAAAPSDPGLTSMVLCIAGGMTAPALAHHNVPDTAGDHVPHITKAASSDANCTFCECVEPWFAHPVRDVTSVLLGCVCELQQQLPSR